MAGAATRKGPERGLSSRASAASFVLLSLLFVLYTLTVLASALGLAPLGSPLAAWLVLGAGALLTAVGAWRLLGVRLTTSLSHAPLAAPRALCALLLTVAVCGLLATLVGVVLALWLPVGAYDAIGYRLPAVVQWLDQGAVSWVPGDDPLRNGYPLGLEVIEALLFCAFDSAAPVDAVASLFLLLGAGSLFGYARELGLSRALAGFAAGLFLLVPMHLLNAPSGYADAAFAGCLVAFLVGCARWVHRSTAPTSRMQVGFAAALTIALKPHGFAFVGVALATSLGLRARTLGIRRAAREGGAVLTLLLPGLFFAVRNVLTTGNPIYPLELRVGTHVLLPGKASLDAILTPDYNVPAQLASLPAFLRAPFVWLQPYGPARSFDDRLAGFGYAFVLLALPAMLWLAVRAYRTRRVQPGVAMFLGLTWLCWLLQPFAFWSRFTSWLWGAAALALALAVHALVESGRGRSALLLVGCTLLLVLPEAVYALHHVKRLDRFGLALLQADALSALVKVAKVDADFVQRHLVGKRDVCRSTWRLGTDDANLDGVVAQLTPRPRMHVIDDAPTPALLSATRAHGCDELIVIGDSPLPSRAPRSLSARITRARAFGSVQLLPALPAEVIP
jgi:hypothetical protein